MRRTLTTDLLLIFLLGLAAVGWAESHWLVRTADALLWANAFNQALLDTLLGKASSGIIFPIPDWILAIASFTILLPLWRRLLRLGS